MLDQHKLSFYLPSMYFNNVLGNGIRPPMPLSPHFYHLHVLFPKQKVAYVKIQSKCRGLFWFMSQRNKIYPHLKVGRIQRRSLEKMCFDRYTNRRSVIRRRKVEINQIKFLAYNYRRRRKVGTKQIKFLT